MIQPSRPADPAEDGPSGADADADSGADTRAHADPGVGAAGNPFAAPPRPTPAELDRLGDEIAELAAHLHAAEHRLLERLAEFDRKEGWTGFQSCAHWLSWRTGIGPGAAREKVRVARALATLPLIGERMARGEFSYSKVRALTRIATPANEPKLVEFARLASAAQTERMVRGWRFVDRVEAEEAASGLDEAFAAMDEAARHRSRRLDLWRKESGSWRIEGELDPEVGALLERALEMAAEALFRKWKGEEKRKGEVRAAEEVGTAREVGAARDVGATAERIHPGQRRADALGLLAEAALRSGIGDDASTSTGRADRFQVMLHRVVDRKEFAGRGGKACECGAGAGAAVGIEPEARAALGFQVAGGLDVPAETLRRLSCDASRVDVTHAADDGSVLDVGRSRRTAPPAIRRALENRDGGGCRFPGCGRGFCASHHIEHWIDGGATKRDNLVLLCRTHHRAVHEGGWGVAFEEEAGRLRLRFRRPDGSLLPEVPESPAVPPDPAAALGRGSEARGVKVDAWTAAPTSDGRLDLGLAITSMWEPRMKDRDADAEGLGRR
jgi:hypothetical protein